MTARGTAVGEEVGGQGAYLLVGLEHARYCRVRVDHVALAGVLPPVGRRPGQGPA